MCTNPFPLKVERPGRKYEEAPIYDYIHVPCGKCLQCRAAKARSWQFRMSEEALRSPSKYFITLTYDDEHLPSDYQLKKVDLQLFFKRLRRNYERDLIAPNKYIAYSHIKYFACGEYGDLFYRPHYHACIFFEHKIDIVRFYHLLKKSWTLGNIVIGTITTASIAYVTKYMVKQWFDDGRQKPFQLMSKRPYIGSEFLTDSLIKYFNTVDGMIQFPDLQDHMQVVPRIYKTKSLTDETRKKKLREMFALQNQKLAEYEKKVYEQGIDYVVEQILYEKLRNEIKEFKSRKRK